jgi:hypothetical protein
MLIRFSAQLCIGGVSPHEGSRVEAWPSKGKTANPIAVLKDDDGGLRSEGNGHEESEEKACWEKSFEKMQAHQSVFARRAADSVA